MICLPVYQLGMFFVGCLKWAAQHGCHDEESEKCPEFKSIWRMVCCHACRKCVVLNCCRCAGEVLLREVIRHIMAARAIHNVFKMSEFQLIITNSAVRFVSAALLHLPPVITTVRSTVPQLDHKSVSF